MKNSFVMSAILIVALVVISCKKDKHDDGSSGGKKWRVTTVAGDGFSGFNDGPALTARFKTVLDVAVTPDGSIYVADALNHRIRKIAGGMVSTFAGSALSDTIGGVGSNASFVHPSQLAVDSSGNLYTLDLEDPRVRKITPGALVTVVAGKGTEGFANGRADTAMFGEEASGIVAGPDGSIYVSDFNNKRIRKISATGIVTTFAGSGQTGFINGNPDVAEFFSPAGIVMDRQGNLLITDFNRIRHVTPAGFVSLLTGKDSSGYRDGPLAVALFSEVNDIVIDAQENMYVADGNRIRKITPQGIVSTIAGSTGGFQDGEGSVAKFNDIVGLGIDRQGNIYAADVNNHRIRKISFE